MTTRVDNKIDITQMTEDDWAFYLDNYGVVRDLVDITPDHMENIYAIAYEYYQLQRLDEAQSLFRLLCTLDHYDSRFYLGLGAIYQAKNEYSEAVNVYSSAVFIDVENPKFPFYAGECHLALGNIKEADSGFFACIKNAGEQPAFAELKLRAESYLSQLQTLGLQSTGNNTGDTNYVHQ